MDSYVLSSEMSCTSITLLVAISAKEFSRVRARSAAKEECVLFSDTRYREKMLAGPRF